MKAPGATQPGAALRRIEVLDPAQLYVMNGAVIWTATSELRVPLARLDLLGAPSWEDDPQTWTGGMPPSPSRGWCVEAPCGLQFILEQDWYHPWEPGLDHLTVNVALPEETAHVLLHLPFEAVLLWQAAPPPAQPLRSGFRVVRIDDAGGRYEVGLFPRRESAQCVAACYEARGHKQGYLVEAVGEPPERFTRGEWRVVRQDDAGFRAEVRSYPTRGWAEQVAELLGREPRHKQTYWVERT